MGGPGRYTSYKATITGVSGGEGSLSDRKSLLGYETWRLAPHGRLTHCSASLNNTIKTRMVQGHEIINDFLQCIYSVLKHTTEEVRYPFDA